MAVIWSQAAWAAECTCATSASNGGPQLGEIVAAQGVVLASRAAGLGPAGSGSLLFSGSQVITGPESTASINVGRSCALSLGPNSEVTIEQAGADICVRVSEVPGPTGATGVSTAGNVPNLLPLVIIGGGVGLALALGGGDDDASD